MWISQALLLAGPKGLTILEMIDMVNKFGLTGKGLPWSAERGKRGHLNQCVMQDSTFCFVGGSQTKGFIYAHEVFPGVRKSPHADAGPPPGAPAPSSGTL